MSVVDELVTIIRFDMPGESKRALNSVNKVVRGITDKIKTLGIVSAATSGIMAAWGINAGKSAQDMQNLAQSLGLHTDELQQLHGLYGQLGGDAKEFAQDAWNYYNMSGKALDVDAMTSIARDFAGASKEYTQQVLRANGFTETFIRGVLQGADEIRKKAGDAPFASEDSIDQLYGLRLEWNKLKQTIEPLSIEVQAAVSPLLMDGMAWLRELLQDNWDDIVETFYWASETIRGIWRRITAFTRKTWDAIGPTVKAGALRVYDFIVDALGKIPGAASEIWDKVGPVLTEGWNAVVGALGPIADNYIGMWKSAFNAVYDEASKIDLAGVWEYLKPSDELVETIRSAFGSITTSIGNFYGNIKKSIESGSIGRIMDSLKEIAESPVVAWLLKKFKALSEVISGIGWDVLAAGFQSLEKVGGGLLDVLDGILQAISGVVNLDWTKFTTGMKKVLDALIEPWKDFFNKIIPELIQQVLIKLAKVIPGLSRIIGDPAEDLKHVRDAQNNHSDDVAMKNAEEYVRNEIFTKGSWGNLRRGATDEQIKAAGREHWAAMGQAVDYPVSPSSPMAGGAANNQTTNASEVTNYNTFHITGSDSEEIGQAVVGELQSQAQMTSPRETLAHIGT